MILTLGAGEGSTSPELSIAEGRADIRREPGLVAALRGKRGDWPGLFPPVYLQEKKNNL